MPRRPARAAPPELAPTSNGSAGRQDLFHSAPHDPAGFPPTQLSRAQGHAQATPRGRAAPVRPTYAALAPRPVAPPADPELPRLTHAAPVAPDQVRRLRREAWVSQLTRSLDALDRAAYTRARQVRELVYGPQSPEGWQAGAPDLPVTHPIGQEDWCVVDQAAAPSPRTRSRALE